ncbi:MAG TPA: TrmH family RNA methyltransferase, partial [Flavobacterium sp.]|nr:TrmH family RNA methyltransferase [Flavobacterium sp.]
TETVDWEYVKEVMQVVDRLKGENVKIVSVEQVEGSVMLNDFEVKSSEKYALFFGNEVKGVNQQVIDNSDVVVEIPQLGTKHSLNVSVSGGIVIWDVFQKMKTL